MPRADLRAGGIAQRKPQSNLPALLSKRLLQQVDRDARHAKRAFTQPSGPYKRLQASYTLPTGYNQTTFLGYEETSGSKGVSISASLAYLGGPATTLAMPDFSTLSGWNNSWPPASGSTVDWIVGALGFTGSSCGEGAKSISAGRTGTR